MSGESSISLELISDFNVELFGRYLTNSTTPPICSVQVSPFGQIFQTLSAKPSDVSRSGGAVIWTRPEAVIESLARAVAFEKIDHDRVLADIEPYAELVERYARDCRSLIIPSWALSSSFRGYGPLDYRPGLGLSHLIARANLFLADRWAAHPNIYMLDSSRWLAAAPSRNHSDKLWFAAKIPFPAPVFEEAALDIKALLRGIAGRTCKLVILDLDDTLWGGVVGETGWQGIRLGGHDHVGEAFVAFQRALKALTRRGIQLAIVSKNDSATALKAIDEHPEMQLRRADFAGWRINWNDKAENIVDLVDELRLGLDSVVFIDDNPAEQGRVRGALPAIMVPDWPTDPAMYRGALEGLRCFDLPALSAEDRVRTALYATERDRRTSRAVVSSPEEWLRTLSVRVRIESLTPANLPRTVQLFNKTNQFNLSTRRLTERELNDWCASPERSMWTATVSDRFGDLGLTGIISLDERGADFEITDLILSCRAMGRKVENAMLHFVVQEAARRGAKTVFMRFQRTERNLPALEFLDGSEFNRDGDIFRWDCRQPYPLPDVVTLNR